MISFYSVHSSQLNSALAACPSLTSLVANPVCSTSATQTIVKTIPPSTPTATATKTGTATATTTPSASAVSTGGAKGLCVGGIMLAVGGLGVVALLL